MRALVACLLAVVPALPVAASGPRDADLENFLSTATVVSKKEIGSGVTKPWKLELELDGRRMTAAFKTVDIHVPGLSQFPDGSKEVDFSDDYRYEIAAYLIDRRLGMNMVPVAVLREIDGETGAVIEWVEDAVSEAKRAQIDPSVPDYLRRQRSVMLMFDSLIANVDRHDGNQLITADGKLHLIDHSRAFRKQRKLPRPFEKTASGITREVLDNLETLTREELGEMLADLLTKVQLEALWRRREGIVKKIQADIAEYGDAIIVWDPARFVAAEERR